MVHWRADDQAQLLGLFLYKERTGGHVGAGDRAGMAPSSHRWATCFTTSTTIHCLLPAPPPCPITQPGSAYTHMCTHMFSLMQTHTTHKQADTTHVHSTHTYTHAHTKHAPMSHESTCSHDTLTCTHAHTYEHVHTLTRCSLWSAWQYCPPPPGRCHLVAAEAGSRPKTGE